MDVHVIDSDISPPEHQDREPQSGSTTTISTI